MSGTKNGENPARSYNWRRSNALGVAPPIVIGIVVALAIGVVGGWSANSAIRPVPAATPHSEIVKVSLVINYATGVSHYLGASPLNGCQYQNCPLALNLSSGVGTLNLAILCDLTLANVSGHSATVVSLSSTPAGITTIGQTVLLLTTGTLVWAGIVFDFPTSPAAYSVVVTIHAT